MHIRLPKSQLLHHAKTAHEAAGLGLSATLLLFTILHPFPLLNSNLDFSLFSKVFERAVQSRTSTDMNILNCL